MEDGWVTLRCSWLDEARWCKSVLDAAGIDAEIPDEYTPALPLTAEMERGPVRLVVRAADVERALEVLAASDTWTPVE
jgi:hypothetical protein